MQLQSGKKSENFWNTQNIPYFQIPLTKIKFIFSSQPHDDSMNFKEGNISLINTIVEINETILNLEQLNILRYQQQAMRLQFKAKQPMKQKVLWLKFKDKIQFQKWDLALYCNWRIIKDLQTYKQGKHLFGGQQKNQRHLLPQAKVSSYIKNKIFVKTEKVALEQILEQNASKNKKQINFNERLPDIFTTEVLLQTKTYNQTLKNQLTRMSKLTQNQAQSQKNDIFWLQNGVIMTKYSKDAFFQHVKKVYVDQHVKYLCWHEVDTKEAPKKIALDEIRSISQSQIGDGIVKHLQPKQIINKKCFVVIHCNSKDRKVLQFGSKNQLLVSQFCERLEHIVHKIHILKEH